MSHRHRPAAAAGQADRPSDERSRRASPAHRRLVHHRRRPDLHLDHRIDEKGQEPRRRRAMQRPDLHPETSNYYVEIRGNALTEPDHDYVFADRLGQRYATDMRSFDSAVTRRLRVAIEPLKVVVTDVRG